MHVAMNIVEDIYSIDETIYVYMCENVCMPDGTSVRGGYGLMYGVTKDGPVQTHVITIDISCDFIEAATVLIHEYAHVLSQQNHDFLMYELWREYLREEFRREYLREEFQRRWYNAIGKEDWETDRRGTIVVGEVCCDTED
jgi:hypothetical protein